MAEPPSDAILAVRPFHSMSWLVVCVLFFVIALWLRFIYFLRKNLSSLENTLQVSVFSAWLLFVLVNAYYGGTLTSYFATSPSLPFQSLREALLKYPSWKLIMISGYEGKVKRWVDVDPVFAEYWNHMEQHPEELTAKSISEGIQRLHQPGNYILVSKQSFIAEITRNKDVVKDMKLASVTHEIGPSVAPLTRHSPYTIFFNRAVLELRQAGRIGAEIKRSVGQLPESDNALGESEELNFGQLLVPFVFIYLAPFASLAVLFIERVYYKYRLSQYNLDQD